MSVLETIVRGVQSLSPREQVEVARFVHRLSAAAADDREAILRKTHGALDDEDGEAFEEALRTSRRVESHG